MSRLFLSVHPSQEVIDLLLELPRKNQRWVRFLRPENWHITLNFLGEADVDRVIEAMNRAELAPTIAKAGPAIDLLGSHSVVLPIGGLDTLAGEVRRATSGLGSETDPRGFVGHLTVARVRKGAIVRKVVGMLLTAEFAIESVELVESRLRPDGPLYDTIQSWPVGLASQQTPGRHPRPAPGRC